MGQFHHPNIVQLYGVVTSGDAVSLDVTATLRPYHNMCLYS